ncbi:ABC transporter permease [Nesterenkonia sp. F]|uniref:ABC transporter permease n=1 Tax=Nesterenkonia sp. F TaxID=795955 RepID=UPI000255D214|nr:ABC transporter permease [Nesterenkonia sp. F]
MSEKTELDDAAARTDGTATHPTAPASSTGSAAATPDAPDPAGGSGGGKETEASLWADAWRSLRRNPWFLVSGALLVVIVAMAIVPQLFTSVDPGSCDLSKSRQAPSAEHWFGTDIQGCDYYTRVIHGARNSMIVGVVVSIGVFAFAVVVGLLAGYFGGWVDGLLSRITDMIFAIPYMLGALVFLNIIDTRGPIQVALVLMLFTWPTSARLMRGSVMSVVNSEYVMAAKALGAGHLTIMRRHILPNSLGPLIGYSTVFIGIIIGAEATLTFLGVGLQLPAISWGLQLTDAQSYVTSSPHLLLFPVIFVGVTVFAFMTLGDAVRDALDPKSKR